MGPAAVAGTSAGQGEVDLGPIVVDEAFMEADAEGIEIAFEPTSNLYVVAYQRAYIVAAEEARGARKFEAAMAVNEIAAQEEEKRKAGVAAAPGAANTGSASTPPLGAASAPSATAAATTAPGAATTAESSAAGGADNTSAASAAPQPPPAVDESAILSDPHGQWATTAEASSYYGGDNGSKPRYGAIQATGAPNVPAYSDNPLSWTPKSGDSPTPEWLALTYARPVHATAVKIRQSAAPGVIARIELIEPDGGSHVLWEGTDSTAYPRNSISWFVRESPRTDYLVNRIRLTLQTNRVWGWNEIDAVQLVGEP